MWNWQHIETPKLVGVGFFFYFLFFGCASQFSVQIRLRQSSATLKPAVCVHSASSKGYLLKSIKAAVAVSVHFGVLKFYELRGQENTFSAAVHLAQCRVKHYRWSSFVKFCFTLMHRNFTAIAKTKKMLFWSL